MTVPDTNLVYLFLAGLFILTLLKPRLAILVCLIILPSYLLKLSILGLPTTFLELSIWAVFIGCIIFLINHNRHSCPVINGINSSRNPAINRSWIPVYTGMTLWKSIKEKIPKKLFWPIVFFIIITLISAIFSDNLKISLGGWKAWVFDPILLFILILSFFNLEKIWELVSALGISGFVLSLYGLYEYFFLFNNLGDGRLDSVFDPANYHAMFVGPIIVLLIGLLFSKTTPKIIKKIFGLLIAVNFIALILTFSYGAFLAVFLAIFFLGLKQFNKGRIKKMVLGFSVIILIFLALAIPTKKFQDLFEYNARTSGHARLEIWQTSFLIIKQHPLVGVGINNFEDNYRATVPQVAFPPLEWLVAQPHSLYLALLTETGIFGFLTFLWIIITILTTQNKSSPTSYKLQATSYVAVLLAILVHGFVDTTYFKNDLAIIFWIIIACFIFTIDKKNSNRIQNYK